MIQQPSPLDFFAELVWLDGTPLLDTIEPYRRGIFESVFLRFDPDGRRHFNTALLGRAKKNYKTSDLVLAALYCLLVVESPQGNDCYIVANDEDQAGDDLDLAKKLIAVNPVLQAEVSVQAKEIARLDGRGSLCILPARDVLGMHGKTYLFLGIDEMHGYRNYDVLEAMAPDPTRLDSIVWITTYASVYHTLGAPLHDYFQRGREGSDPRMFFAWYSADYCTDPACADLPPEVRANPSMASWGNPDYLEQQRRRLPTHKYRRLHLNLPGMPDGQYFDPDTVQAAVIAGRREIQPATPRPRYVAFVDMSGGAQDDAVLGIAHHDMKSRKAVLDVLVSQSGKPPFDPRKAVAKFAGILKFFGIKAVCGDNYGGEIFKRDFAGHDIGYRPCELTKHELYEEFEPILNAQAIELLDIAKLTEQLLGLVVRGLKIDHQPGEHDDWANACAGAAWLATRGFVQADLPSMIVHPAPNWDPHKGLASFSTSAKPSVVYRPPPGKIAEALRGEIALLEAEQSQAKLDGQERKVRRLEGRIGQLKAKLAELQRAAA